MTKLEKIQAWATIVSLLLVPVLVVWIQRTAATEDTRRGYVELATSILKDTSGSQNPALRKWAVQILNESSPVPLNEMLQAQLETGETTLAAPTAPTIHVR